MPKPFRVPVVGSYNTRVTTTNAQSSASGFVGVGVVGVMIVGNPSTSSTKDFRMVNCFTETVSDPATGQRQIYCTKRPGFGTNSTPAAGSIGTAVMVWSGQGTGTKVISAFGGTNSTIYDGTTSLGAITGKARSIKETFVGANVATLLIASTDSTGWYYDVATGSATKIADADFPGNAGFTTAGDFATIDGFNCIMDTTGGLWASDLNSITGWTATSFGSANAYPDKGIGCIRYKTYIMAFGTQSIEFFYNAGLTPFPLAKNQALTVRVGAVSSDAITQISDTVFWCGSTPEGGLSIFKYDGGVNRVSTPEIDGIMLIAGASAITLTSIRFYGRSFIVCNVGTRSLVYCIEESSWSEWAGNTVLWYKCAGVSVGATMVNYAVSNISTSGKVFVMNQASLVFTDNGYAFSARVQMSPMDLGTMRMKVYHDVELVADTETSTSTLTISATDDDYQTFTALGTVDLSHERKRLPRCGAARRRGWVFTHSATTPMRLLALEGNVTVGNN